MKNTIKITYWISTLLVSFAMLSSGIIQLLLVPFEVEAIAKLGYPAYFLLIIGGWKILGVIAILIPKYPLLKEWAYAGFFFTMTGAFFSHTAVGDPFGMMFPSILLTILIVVSWHTRPETRQLRA